MSKNPNEDPLKDLLSTEAKSLDKKKLADFLKPYIIIDPETKEVGFHTPFKKIKNNRDKLEVVLLASKVLSLLFGNPDGMGQGDVISLQIMPTGSVKSSLNALLKANKVKQDSEGRYYIPNYRIDSVIENNTLTA